MNDLLTLASTQLAATGPHANRRACWLARAALEGLVDDLLAVRGIHPGEQASARSRLACLEVAYAETPKTAAHAQYAWFALSEACHQHAYQLSPTYSEARHLLRLVESLASTHAGS